MLQRALPLSFFNRTSISSSSSPSLYALSRTMGGQKRIETFFTTTSAAKRSKATTEEDAGPSTTTTTAPPPPPPPTDNNLHALQIAALQQMRAEANRTCALAKQIVIKAEQSGTPPSLPDLLIEPTWKALMQDQLNAAYFKQLQSFLHSEWTGNQPIFPPKDSIFRAFNSCPVEKVRVVILGQDPYHDLGQAQGLSFSVPQGKQLPSSLRNIYKELREDLSCPLATHGCLEKWSHQGVLLLNAVLTVRAHAAASHGKKGWEKFTDEAIRRLSREGSGIVFILWGKYAQDKGKVIDGKKHYILTSPHPSGLSAHRGFFGCKHFSQCNALLEKDGKLPIDWCIE